MNIKVEKCWSGGNKFSFRLTMPDGKREYVTGEDWTRAIATEAKNRLSNLYGLKRRNIKFI